MKMISGVLVLVFSLGLPLTGLAEQSQSFGDYTVHYSAFTTDILTPSVAKSYEIQRSKNRVLINISVLKKVMGTSGTPVRAVISGTATNLSEQLRKLEVRELNESGAIYYIAVLPIANNETLKFNFLITPDGEDSPHSLTFQQQFVTN